MELFQPDAGMVGHVLTIIFGLSPTHTSAFTQTRSFARARTHPSTHTHTHIHTHARARALALRLTFSLAQKPSTTFLLQSDTHSSGIAYTEGSIVSVINMIVVRSVSSFSEFHICSAVALPVQKPGLRLLPHWSFRVTREKRRLRHFLLRSGKLLLTVGLLAGLGHPGAGIMEADDRQVTTVFTVQPSFHRGHSRNRVS